MKKIIMISIISITFAGTAQASGHHNNDLSGIIIGAGGGALLGQAIGRNTQATVVGTAIGSIVGYIVSNEMDKGRGYSSNVTHYRSQPVRYRHYEPVIVKPHPQTWHKPAPKNQCREAEILGTINGRAKKMYGTVCRTPGGWQLVSQDKPYYNEYRKNGGYKPKGKKDRHGSYSSNRGWVKHRF